MASFTEEELLQYFNATPPLYCTLRGDPSDDAQLGLKMVPIIAEYALIGRNVLAHWTVILHGRSSHFKVMDRGGRWFIFSLAPR